MVNNTDAEIDDMKEIIEDFLVEADELVQSLDANFVKLEAAPNDLALLNEIFRAAHTVKGTSSFLGFEQVTELTHKMEDVLNKLRKGELVVTPVVMDVLLESLDLLKVLLTIVREHKGEMLDLTAILAKLVDIYEGKQELSVAPVQVTAKESGIPAAEAAGTNASDGDPDSIESVATQSAQKTAIKSPTAATPKKSADSTIRVDVERLDQLMNMMGELVLGRNSLLQNVNKLAAEHDGDYHLESLNQACKSVNFITTELQMAVMKMRMQPVGKVFGRFPRLVRDLSRDSGKQIDLIIEGEATELDKSVIEEIGDPLVHIIRNSCDHGIEMPDARIEKGKPAQGTVRLTACQEGSNIIIRLQDDGKGLDIAAIRAKAVERGLASQADVDRMADREVFSYIFEAGFSTAKVITDVSGRGVGMDVVRTNIEKLNGQIELESQVNVGTTITIKLPLTLAILQGLLTECDNEVYILPLSSVYETVRTEQSLIHYVNQRPVLRLRDEVIPIVNLNEIIRKNKAGFVLTEKPYIVVVGLAEQKLGIIIDRFLGQEEVVIKSLGTYFGSTEGVAGATILGDGRIRLIVDLIGLFAIARKLA
ncbi:MAG: chemotaxis protein CheA [Candidatus Zixiibacteriota bacterium]